MWSKLFESFIRCRKTDYAHVSKGLCNSCYLSDYRKHNSSKIKKQKRRWYIANVDFTRSKLAREQRYFSGLREPALKRDGYKCVTCGKTKPLVVHHKDHNGRGVETPHNELDNLVTLCRGCHINVHREELMQARRGEFVSRQPIQRKPPYKQKPIDSWARHFSCCIVCHSTVQPHKGHGVCRLCSQRARAKALKI